MRLISQDGWDETSYERSDVRITDDGNFYIIEVTKEKSTPHGRSVYAEYANESIALMALEKMRKSFREKYDYFKFPTMEQMMKEQMNNYE